jgi:hypothetical protein
MARPGAPRRRASGSCRPYHQLPNATRPFAFVIVPLSLALSHLWQLGVLAVALLWLLALRRGVVSALVGAAALGIIAALAGAPL